MLVKIAPDLSLGELDDIVGIVRARRADGMIVGNTTTGRPPNLRERAKAMEQGGLSGRPLFALSTRMLAETFVRAESAFPLIGVGGIDSGASALQKIRAGASLVQLYTGLIFRGLSLLAGDQARIARHAGTGPAFLACRLRRRRCRGDDGRALAAMNPRTVSGCAAR